MDYTHVKVGLRIFATLVMIAQASCASSQRVHNYACLRIFVLMLPGTGGYSIANVMGTGTRGPVSFL